MDKTPILWLPGLLCDERLFSPLYPWLPDDTYNVCPVLPAENSMAKMAAQILKDAPETFILAGLSMGGILAFELFRQAPQRVKGLILMNTNAADEKPEVSQKRNLLVARAQAGEFSNITPENIFPVLIHPDRQIDERLKQTICEMAESVSEQAFIKHAQALAERPDSIPTLAKIKVPTLVICSREDALCPVSNHSLMAERLEQVTFLQISHCGHLSTMEHPERIGRMLTTWLATAVNKETSDNS
ncbi:alpha/beta hydrolase [Endozoicomonas sp. 4G]|uniref:alpha/beta fold hydrolase n=1 Tax=Endozoicomonas sp. 4G TaxID=2872754 RepID=UPI00207856E8|nr:alpha/beta hydrolase [Endozoicomonas sp. 4G]